jgi:hypothetical protein
LKMHFLKYRLMICKAGLHIAATIPHLSKVVCTALH